jgi:hypothetical protein
MEEAVVVPSSVVITIIMACLHLGSRKRENQLSTVVDISFLHITDVMLLHNERSIIHQAFKEDVQRLF